MSSRKDGSGTADFITVKEAAALSSYAPAYLTRLAKKGDIEAKKDGRIWLIKAASLKEYLSAIEHRKVQNRARLRAERVSKLSTAGYSAAWLFHKSNMGAFDTKAVLESLAIAGLSALIGMMTQSFVGSGTSTGDLLDGAVVVLGNLNVQTEAISVSLAQLSSEIGGEALLAGVWSLFF